jgi:hypothetical protein
MKKRVVVVILEVFRDDAGVYAGNGDCDEVLATIGTVGGAATTGCGGVVVDEEVS